MENNRSAELGKRLLLIGGGGHCKSVIDSVISAGEYSEIGVIDSTTNNIYQEVRVVGDDGNLASLLKEGWEYAFVTVGSVGDTKTRRKLFNLVKSLGFIVPVILDPTSAVAKEATIGEGTYVGKNSVVNSCASIGTCAIVNTGAIVEHDCEIGDFAHISPGVVLCGGVHIGNDSHLGSGSVVRQQILIGNDVMIGAGSVVVSNIEDGVKAYGNPCKAVNR